DKIFSTATAYVNGKDKFAGAILSSFLMIAFAQSSVLYQTILIHASVVEKDGKGYAFLGKSGTGKSTHSSLWLRYVEGVELLNDDNPAIRIEEGNVYVYGTPWSGKTPCYKNRKAPLKALVRLEQAPVNRFTWKKGVDALITLLPSCSALRWNTLLYTAMCNGLENVIGKVRIGYLECLPDKKAAMLCYKKMKQI
ncbi:MAG: phosphoenolpyruvate carboxykinase, partial [Dysgonamonadaceae bacterium]|nr:phosphoenolpyruvate carboxykinase [Dysgonamonadaceae bacterium]